MLWFLHLEHGKAARLLARLRILHKINEKFSAISTTGSLQSSSNDE